MELIDAHIHLCRSRAEESKVFHREGWPIEWYWANEERIGAYLDLWGISHVVAPNIMDTGAMSRSRLAKAGAGDLEGAARAAVEADVREELQGKVRVFNDWICDFAARDPRVIPFPMIDPVLFSDGLAGELEGWVARGARGIKVHPVICDHYPDDARMHPIYEVAEDRGLVVLTDTTAHPDRRGRHVGAPLEWAPVLEKFPRLKLQIAHLPGGRWEERIELARRFTENVWFDTSQGFVDVLHPPGEHRQLGSSAAVGVLREIGIHRVLFASDAPGGGVDIVDLAAQILRLDLSDDEKEQILAGNTRRLLDL